MDLLAWMPQPDPHQKSDLLSRDCYSKKLSTSLQLLKVRAIKQQLSTDCGSLFFFKKRFSEDFTHQLPNQFRVMAFSDSAITLAARYLKKSDFSPLL